MNQRLRRARKWLRAGVPPSLVSRATGIPVADLRRDAAAAEGLCELFARVARGERGWQGAAWVLERHPLSGKAATERTLDARLRRRAMREGPVQLTLPLADVSDDALREALDALERRGKAD